MNLINLLKKELLTREILIRRINIKEFNSINYLKEDTDVIRELGLLDAGSLVVDVEPVKIRTFEACAFTPLEKSCPWVDTAKLIINNQLFDYEDSPLYEFYKNWSPKTAYEYYNIDNQQKSKLLFEDPIDVPYPWEVISQRRWSKMHRKNLRIEGKNYKAINGKISGWPCSGGMSNATAKSHFERLKKVAYSIRERGYIRNNKNDGDIQAILFVKDSKSQPIFKTYAGGHRVSAYGALNPKKIPIRINCSSIYMVKRWESKYWFNVRNNLFTEKQALGIFDKIYFGKSPYVYKEN